MSYGLSDVAKLLVETAGLLLRTAVTNCGEFARDKIVVIWWSFLDLTRVN
jgi:hypothetical protein